MRAVVRMLVHMLLGHSDLWRWILDHFRSEFSAEPSTASESFDLAPARYAEMLREFPGKRPDVMRLNKPEQPVKNHETRTTHFRLVRGADEYRGRRC
jgi:hypothetical protein